MTDRQRGGTDDRWVRDALEDAVADVEPRSDLAGVRARLDEETRTRGRTRWAAAAAGLAVAATVAAVALATGLGGDDEAPGPAASPSATPEQTPPSSASPSTSDGETVTSFDGPVPVYYVGDTPTGPRLFREFQAPQGDGDALTVAVRMATGFAPSDPDYRVPWPAGTTATATYDAAGDLVTVDLQSGHRPARPPRRHGRGRGADGAAAARPHRPGRGAGTAAGEVPLDGEATDQLLGEPASEPLAEGDPMQVQAPVWVIDPQDSTAFNGDLQVEGRGAFFEANVSWQVLQGGSVVKEGFATAEECCTLAPFRFTVEGLAPGDYVLRVYDADVSGGEGPGEHEDTKRFTVAG